MKRILWCATLIVLAFGFFHTAAAHEYKTDGSVTVLLHSNPDDDPIAAEPASLFFQVSDTSERFDPALCDCSVTISNQGQKLFGGSLFRIGGPSIYSFTIPFTFPKKAVYSISVTGKPKAVGTFQSFQVQYDLRISREVLPQPKKVPVTMIALVAIAIMAGIGLYFKSKNN